MPYANAEPQDKTFMQQAIEEAKKGYNSGGIPIGSVLVIDNEVVGRGHNQRVQLDSPILHGEMDCLNNAGRLSPQQYRRATIYTTLSPCSMCSGTILLYEIPRVVIAENDNFLGDEALLQSRDVALVLLNDAEAKALMKRFIEENPELWFEDIGEV